MLRPILITPTNVRRLAARIVPQDQRAALQPGHVMSQYTFSTRQGQPGYGLIDHTTQEAGVCLADSPSIWGAWSAQTGTITTSEGCVYNRVGELVCDLKEQLQA